MLESKKVYFCANNFFILSNFRIRIIKEFASKGYKVILIACTDGFENDLKNIKNVIIKAFYPKNNGIDFLQYLFFIIKIYFKENKGYFYTFSSKANVMYGLISYFKTNKLFINITGLGALWDIKYLRPFVKILFWISMRNANTIFCQNKRDYKLFKSIFPNNIPSIVQIPGSGVDLNKFYFPKKEKDFKVIKFAMVSRLKNKKGFEVFLKACDIFKSKVRNPEDYKFIFVTGYKSNLQKVKVLKKEYPSVEILDFIKNISNFYRKVDCIILPSIYNEGTPKSLIESLACGCAIITTKLPGCEDTIIENRNGYFLKSISAANLANLMIKYSKLDKSLKKNFSLNSRDLAERKFNDVKIIDLYNETLKNNF